MPESEMTDATSKPATPKKVADDAREKIGSLPRGPERHAMLKATWQADNAVS